MKPKFEVGDRVVYYLKPVTYGTVKECLETQHHNLYYRVEWDILGAARYEDQGELLFADEFREILWRTTQGSYWLSELDTSPQWEMPVRGHSQT